jgi:hypothetical protein
MWWPLSQLWFVLVIVLLSLPFLLINWEQQRFWEQREAKMVASWFFRGLYACRGAGTHPDSQQRRELSEGA